MILIAVALFILLLRHTNYDLEAVLRPDLELVLEILQDGARLSAR